jgi:hypothetical protein
VPYLMACRYGLVMLRFMNELEIAMSHMPEFQNNVHTTHRDKYKDFFFSNQSKL